MKYWLGVTDNGWFEFLSHQQPDEVNFWQPSVKAPFVGLEPGAPFLFKLKRPFNHVQRRRAITGESTLPVLEAAHILPFAEHGPNEVANDLLLRSDFHKLFDLGLVTVTPELSIEVSAQIREEWFNGKAYYRLHGQRLANVPKRACASPCLRLFEMAQ